MRISVVSIGSFDTQYSDYHLLKDIIVGLLKREHSIYLYQKQYLNQPKYPDEFDTFLSSGQLKVFNFPFERKQHTNLKARYIADVKYFYKVCKQLKSMNPDVVYLQSNNTAFVTVFYVKHFLKKPLLYNEQDIFPENARLVGALDEKSLIYKIAYKLQKYAYRNATVISTISEDMRDTILSQYFIPKEKIQVIYNWGHEQFPKSNQNVFLSKYPKVDKEFRVVYAGNLGKMQNVEYILDTAKLLKENRNITFYIVGSGANEISLKEYVKENSLTNVLFVEMQSQNTVGDLYSSADVNLIPLRPGLIFAALPSKTADCLLANKPVLFCFDEKSKFVTMATKYGIGNADPHHPEQLKQLLVNIQKGGSNGETLLAWKENFMKSKNVDRFCKSIEQMKHE